MLSYPHFKGEENNDKAKERNKSSDALVTSKVFSIRVEKAKKGKGSFKRKVKYAGKECYQIVA